MMVPSPYTQTNPSENVSALTYSVAAKAINKGTCQAHIAGGQQLYYHHTKRTGHPQKWNRT